MAKCAVAVCENQTKGENVCCSRACSNRFYPRRKKELHQCGRCKKQFLGRGTCPGCKDEILANKTRFQHTTLEELGKDYEAAGVHRSWWYSEVRSDARKKTDFKSCMICDYDKTVQVCHVKPIASFEKSATIAEVNALTNLVGLCPNHHWELDHGLLAIEDHP